MTGDLPTPGAEVAGRLEVIVESKLDGFARKLKEKVEAAASNIDAKVSVEPDGDSFKKRLEEVVHRAAAGVKATIEVDVDAAGLRERLVEAVRSAGAGVKATVTVGVDVDASTLKARVEAAVKAAASSVKVDLKSTGVSGEVAADVEVAQLEVNRKPIRVPLITKGRLWFEALREKVFAQKVLDRAPLEVPLTVNGSGTKKISEAVGKLKLPRLGSLVRGGMLLAIGSLIEPVIGAIGQLLGGLTAMAGAIGPAFGAFAAVPLGLSAMIQGMLGVTTAAGGVGTALKELTAKQKALADGTKYTAEQQKALDAALKQLSPSAQKFARMIAGRRDDWLKLRRTVQEPLFKPIVAELKPFLDKFLPALQKGLRGTAAAAGDSAAGILRFFQQPRNLNTFSGVMRQNNQTVRAAGTALKYLLSGFLDFQRAAAPFQRRMDRYIVKSAKWFADTMRVNRESGKTAAFLQKAGDRLAQVWEITKTIGSGLLGVFRAGDVSGMRLLDSFQQWLTRWEQWVNSPMGQQRIQGFFNAVEPGFRELGRLIRDTFNGFLKFAEDPKIAGLIKKIRTEFGPALADFLTSLSDTTGSHVIDILTELARTASILEPAIQVVADLTGVLVDLLGVVNSFAEATPGADSLIRVLGYFYAYTKIKKIGGLLGIGAGARAAAGAGAAGGIGAAEVGAGVAAGAGLRGLLARRLAFLRGGTAAAGAAGGLTAAEVGVGAGAGLGAKGIGASLSRAGLTAGRRNAFVAAAIASYQAGATFAGKEIYDATNGVVDSMTGLGQETGKKGKLIAGAFAQVRATLSTPDVENAAKKFNINLDMVTQGILDKANKQQTEFSAYADKSVLQIMGGVSTSFGGRFKDATLGLVGAKDASITNRKALEIYNATVAEALRQAQDARRQTRSYRSMLRDDTIRDSFNLRGPKTLEKPIVDPKSRPKYLRPFLRQDTQKVTVQPRAVGAGAGPLLFNPLRQRTQPQVTIDPIYKVRPPKVDPDIINKAFKPSLLNKPTAVVKEFSDLASRAFDKTKLKPIELPRVKPTEAQKLRKQFADVFLKGGSLPKIKSPKVDTAGVRQEARRTGALFERALGAVKIKPIKAPKVDAKGVKGSARNVVEDVTRQFSRGGRDIEHETQKSMTGYVRAIRGKKGAAKGASKDVADGTKAPFKGLNGQLNGLGVNAMQGLVEGIRTRGAVAVAEAQRVAHAVAAATRHALQVKSPSRVMIAIGQYVSEGLAVGIRQGAKKVEESRKHLTGALMGGLGTRERRKFEDAANRQVRGLNEYAKKQEDAAGRVERANKRADQAKAKAKAGERKQFTKSLVEQQNQYGSLTGLASGANGYITPSYAVDELKRRVTESLAFRKNLRALRKRGLGQRAYKDLLAAGVEAGSPIVDQLLNSTPDQLRQINRLQNQLVKAAKQMGHDAGQKFKDAGGNMSKGMVDGLRANQWKLNHAAKDMAEAFAKEVRRALQIHSPSRVMAAIGRHTIDGLTHGVNRQAPGLIRSARRVTADLSDALQPSVHASALFASSRAANRAGVTTAVPYGGGQSPLVGELVIHGRSAEEVRDALDEAMFALRKIRQGGVHADRTT